MAVINIWLVLIVLLLPLHLQSTVHSILYLTTVPWCPPPLFFPPGEELDPEDRAGDAEAHADAERPEGAGPAAQLPAHLREAAQAGDQPPAGHQAQPGEAEPGTPQVRNTTLTTDTHARIQPRTHIVDTHTHTHNNSHTHRVHVVYLITFTFVNMDRSGSSL